MSLAREKYLKRKRELLGKINLFDEEVEDKKANDKEKVQEKEKDNKPDKERHHKKKSPEPSVQEKVNSKYNKKSSTNKKEELEKRKKERTRNDYEVQKGSIPSKKHQQDYSKINNEDDKEIHKHNRRLEGEHKRIKRHNDKKENHDPLLESLCDLNQMDIHDSRGLLYYVCKLLLHFCGNDKMNQHVVSTSYTSAELLRELKNRNRKSIKFLKINLLNEILCYLSNPSMPILDDIECMPDLYKKHRDINLESKCIDIEYVGINVIIKNVYIRSVKNILMRSRMDASMETVKQSNSSVGIKSTTGEASALTMRNIERKRKEDITAIPPPPPPPPLSTPLHTKEKRNELVYDARGGIMGTTGNTQTSDIFPPPPPPESQLEIEGDQNNQFIRKGTNYFEDSKMRDYSYNNYPYDSGMKDEQYQNTKINYLENLLNEPTAKEKKIKEEKTNILSILEAPTVIEEMRIKRFQKKTDKVKIICPHLTKKICQKHNKECDKVHFKKIISEHTDVSLGDCSYLDTCRHIETCKFVHYAVDKDDQIEDDEEEQQQRQGGEEMNKDKLQNSSKDSKNLLLCSSVSINETVYAPQWIRCDLRNFDLSIFNEYVSVVMADPPWDIHMDLPYGTMTDHEMKHLPVQLIQDEGMIFLWVTGRAMELARECLQIWGYKRVEEILWVKTNHLQRIIRTGRTGHWLNHSKEHCLVGIKGNPIVNRNIDCNVIVSEVRETSRKPDEIYAIIERLCPFNLKIELFGRPHNCRNNWITLGNQLNGVVLHHPQIKERYNKMAEAMKLPLCET